MSSGLRGAIAFALALNLEEFPDETRKLLVTTTLVIVLFTVLFLGGSTLPLLKVREKMLIYLVCVRFVSVYIFCKNSLYRNITLTASPYSASTSWHITPSPNMGRGLKTLD